MQSSSGPVSKMSNAERPTLNNELKAGIAAAVISAKFPTPNDTRFSFQSSSSSRRSEKRKFSRSASSIATYYEVGEHLFGFRASFRRPIPESKRELVFGEQGHRWEALVVCSGSLARIFTSAHRKLSSTFRTKRFHPAGAACCSSYNLVGAARSLERAGLPSYFVRSSCPSGAFFAGKRKIRVGAS